MCGGIPPGFNESAQDARIAAGEENMTFGQLFAIQIFPWLVGLIGLGIPITYVINRYRQARRAGGVTHHAGLEEIGSVLQEDSPQQSVDNHSGTPPTSSGLTAAERLFVWLINQDGLTPGELKQILGDHVASGDITQAEAGLIERLVREEIVLSKDRSQ